MEVSLRGKTAIVTGGSRGIGREIAVKFGHLGASVVVNYVYNRKAAEEVVAEIGNGGGQAIAVQADMKSVAEIRILFDTALEKFGALDILINNAGTLLYKKIEEVTEKEYDEIFAVNVKGLFFACQQAAEKMGEGGKIINISSTVTRMMMPNYGVYAATKGAVEQITKVLAKELGPKNIAVNSLSPGPVDTELFREGKSEEQIQLLASMAAFGRIGTPRDIADIAALLVSEYAGWVSGQNLCANGGFIG